MRLISEGNIPPVLYRGKCKKCGNVYEAEAKELRVQTCPREHYEFAHSQCQRAGCGGTVTFYRRKGYRRKG